VQAKCNELNDVKIVFKISNPPTWSVLLACIKITTAVKLVILESAGYWKQIEISRR